MSKYDENPIDLDAIKPPQEEKQIITSENQGSIFTITKPIDTDIAVVII